MAAGRIAGSVVSGALAGVATWLATGSTEDNLGSWESSMCTGGALGVVDLHSATTTWTTVTGAVVPGAVGASCVCLDEILGCLVAASIILSLWASRSGACAVTHVVVIATASTVSGSGSVVGHGGLAGIIAGIVSSVRFVASAAMSTVAVVTGSWFLSRRAVRSAAVHSASAGEPGLSTGSLERI